MASVNKVIIVGNLGRDPEIRYMPSGDAIANIAVATSYKSKDRQTGEQKELTEWHRISFFGRLAEIVGQYLKKGSSVYVEGRLQTRKYTDKEGVEKYSTEIVGDRMQLLGGGRDAGGGAGGDAEFASSGPSTTSGRRESGGGSGSGGGGGAPRGGGSTKKTTDDFDDDIPF